MISVSYTPSLRDQLRGRQSLRAREDRVVMVRGPHGRMVKAIDPRTRLATKDNQQFVLNDDDTMTILPRWDWIERPETLDVESFRF